MLTAEEITSFRLSLELDEAAFGAWISERMKHEHPWPASSVKAWERGEREIPYSVQATVLRALWLAAIRH